MDSSISQVIPSTTNLSKYNSFRQTCQSQDFSFPKSIMKYIWKNPRSIYSYHKMIKSCKLLFLKNPILIIPILRYTFFDGWKYALNDQLETEYDGLKSIDLKKCESQIWITETLRIFRDSKDIASGLIPKIHWCDIKILQLETQTISLIEFKRLTKAVNHELTMKQVTVENGDGNIVSIDELVDHLSDILIFYYTFCDIHPILSNDSATKLANFCCNKTKKFTLNNIYEGFDITTFCCYLEDNKNRTHIDLQFRQPSSQDYKNQLYGIISNIFFIRPHHGTYEYLPPLISFPSLDFEISFRLSKIVEEEKQKYY